MINFRDIEHPEITRMENYGSLNDEPLLTCDSCELGLYEGDRVYYIENEVLCEDCVKESYSKLL